MTLIHLKLRLTFAQFFGRGEIREGYVDFAFAYPTKISGEWQLGWFCKTQYAGRHGEAHFIRCHKTIISLLDFCRKAGLNVTVQDEAGYWDDRNDVALLKSLRTSEALLAAFGGLLKDMTGKLADRKVESPIFDYPNFEHLEHEGWERFGKLLALLEKAAPP